jgi:hypothetical protein
MAEDEIVTSFRGEGIEDLASDIERLANGLDGYSDAAKVSEANTKSLAATTGSAAAKMHAMTDASKQETTAAQQQAKTLGDLKKQIDALTRNKKTLTDPKEIAQANAQIAQLTAQYKKLDTAQLNTGSAAGKLGASLKGSLGGAVQSLSSGFGGLGGTALAALGPIGIAVGAVGAGLFKAFSNLDSGQVQLEGLGNTGGIVFDKITGKVAQFFDKLTTGDSLFGRVFGALVDAIEFVTTPLQTVLSLLGDVTGITDALKEAQADGLALAEAYDAIDEAQRGVKTTNAGLEKDIAQLNIQLKNRTLGERERLAIADQIAVKEKERAENEMGLLKQVTAAKQKEYDQQLRDKGQVDDEVANALVDAQVAETQAAQGSIELTERVQNRVDQIRAAGEAKREAARKEQQAKEKKVADDRIQLEKDLAKAVNDARTGQQKEEGTAAVQRDERVEKAHGDAELLLQIEEQYQSELTAIRTKYGAEQVKAQDELFAQLSDRRKKLAEDELAQLMEKQGEQVALAAMNGEDLNALLVKQAEERKAFTDSIREAEVEAKLNEFDAEYGQAEKLGLDLLDLTATQQEELAALKQKFRDEDAEAAQESFERQLEAEQEAQAARLDMLTLQADTAANIGELVATVAADNTAAANAALALQKGSAIANAVIAASTARTGAIAGAAANPVIAAGGPAAVLAFAAPTIGLINANLGITIATILAQAITGNYEGDPFVSGPRDLPVSRDAYIRRLHRGERVVTASDNAEHWEPLEAMREGRFEMWVKEQNGPATEVTRIVKAGDRVVSPHDNHVEAYFSSFPNIQEAMSLNFTPSLNTYLESEEGRRDTAAVMFPHAFDRNIVGASRENMKELRGAREDIQELTHVVRSGQHRRSSRYRGN